MQTTKFAVIGMGAVGTTAVIQLIERTLTEQSNDPLEIHCFDSSTDIGRGVAFSTPKDFHILNTRRSSIQHAAEALWPHSLEANRPIRKTFGLPLTRAMGI